MNPLFFLPFYCVLFVLLGLMTSCEKPTSKQEPAAIPAKPAVEKPAEKPEASAAVAAKEEPASVPEEPQVEKPAAKPEASAAVAAKKEPAASPAKPQVEKPAEKPEANKPAAVPDKAQLEQAAKAIVEAARREYLPVVEVTVKRGAAFSYSTGMDGDEQGAIVIAHPKSAVVSTIARRVADFKSIYQYRPKPNFVGKDSVELEYRDHQLGSGPDDPGTTEITRQIVNFTVVENEKKEENEKK